MSKKYGLQEIWFENTVPFNVLLIAKPIAHDGGINVSINQECIGTIKIENQVIKLYNI